MNMLRTASAAVLQRLRGDDATASTTRTTFVSERTPPPEWVAALRDVSPLTNDHGTLAIVWEPGDVWFPVQRWLLMELIPATPELLDFDTLRELKGPNPRTTGHMCTRVTVPGQFACFCRVKLEGWRQEDGSPSGVTLTQWKLYRATGKWALPFWVIQGSRGGHKAFLTGEEQRWLTAAGKPTTMPGMGDLPYTEFDSRVVQHVTRFNRLRTMGLSIQAYRKRMGKDYDIHRAETEREFRKDLVAWLDEQMAADDGEGASVNDLFINAANKREMDHVAPRTDIDWAKVEEQSTANYIETGNFLHPSKVK